MLSKNYRSCTITRQKLGFLIRFSSANKLLIKDARSFSFEGCENWIDRQLAHWAIEKAFGNQ